MAHKILTVESQTQGAKALSAPIDKLARLPKPADVQPVTGRTAAGLGGNGLRLMQEMSCVAGRLAVAIKTV